MSTQKRRYFGDNLIMAEERGNLAQRISKDLLDLLILLVKTVIYYVEALVHCVVKPPLKSLSGEVILITGGANGIGRETALQLAHCRANKIVIWDTDEEGGQRLVEELKTINDCCQALAAKIDVSDRVQVEEGAAVIRKSFGDNVSILINNAGIMPCKPFFDHSPTELEQVFRVNVFANFWTLRTFVPKMIEANRGHVVTVCSAAGLLPVRNLVPYCGSKHAVHGVVEALKDELRNMPTKPDVKFTTIYPYSCNTGLLSGVKSWSRFPWLVPKVLSPQTVAAKLVEGLRRNYEHVYIPVFVQIAGTTLRGLLPKVQYEAASFLQCYVEPAHPKS